MIQIEQAENCTEVREGDRTSGSFMTNEISRRTLLCRNPVTGHKQVMLFSYLV